AFKDYRTRAPYVPGCLPDAADREKRPRGTSPARPHYSQRASRNPRRRGDDLSLALPTMKADSLPGRAASRFRPQSLDALNFLLADVRGGLGPYLNVFLVTQQGWSQSATGLMTTVSGLIGLAAQ